MNLFCLLVVTIILDTIIKQATVLMLADNTRKAILIILIAIIIAIVKR